MKRILTPLGYIAYQATAEETEMLGGCGICDECGKRTPKGYLVPVLNHYMCPACFHEWEHSGRFYPEDIPVERRNTAYFESLIPLERSQENHEP